MVNSLDPTVRPASSTRSVRDAASAQCRSSNTRTTGASTVAASRTSPMRWVWCHRSAAGSAPDPAGLAPTRASSSAGSGTTRPISRTTESHGHKAGAPSSSDPWAHTARQPRATSSSTTLRASLVLPIPASPTRRAVMGRPDSAAWAAASKTALARPRPTSGYRVSGGSTGPGSGWPTGRAGAAYGSVPRVRMSRSASSISGPGSSPDSSRRYSRVDRRTARASSCRCCR